MHIQRITHVQSAYKRNNDNQAHERDVRKALLETLHTHQKKKSETPIFTNLRKRFEHIELPAKLLDYFLRKNKNNCGNGLDHFAK